MPMGPQAVALLATPKIISDFANPEVSVAQFLDHYAPLTSRASETIVIFGVGNSEHILEYRGEDYWDDRVEWARHTGFRHPASYRVLNYHQVDGIVRAFKSRAATTGIELKVFDQIDQGREFAYTAHSPSGPSSRLKSRFG